jgi:hypothetical protein
MSGKEIMARIQEMERLLSATDDSDIDQFAQEVVKEEAKILTESTGIPVSNKMDFSNQNTKMSMIAAANAFVEIAKQIMAEESAGDKQVDKEYEQAVKEEDKVIGASDDSDADDEDTKIASELIRLAGLILSEDEDEEDDKEDDKEEAPVAKKGADETPVEDKEEKTASINDLMKMVASLSQKVDALSKK